MSGAFHVHTSALADAAEAAGRSADRLANLLSDIDHTVRLLLDTWTGTASEGFEQTASRWQSASEDLHASLGQLKVLLSTAHGNYTEAESANLVIWGRG